MAQRMVVQRAYSTVAWIARNLELMTANGRDIQWAEWCFLRKDCYLVQGRAQEMGSRTKFE